MSSQLPFVILCPNLGTVDNWPLSCLTDFDFISLNKSPMFFMDNINLDGIPSKIKWKINVCSTMSFKFQRYFLWNVTRYSCQFLCLLLFYIGFTSTHTIFFYNFLELHSKLSEKRFSTQIFIAPYLNSSKVHILNKKSI